MKKVIFVSGLLISSFGFGQTIEDSLSIKALGYDPRVVGNQFAEAAATWAAEEKEWFKSTFIYKRGGFTVPEKPISYAFSKD